MQAAEAISRWNPDAVIAGAKELIHVSNYEKVNEARQAVDSTANEWVRIATSDPSVAGDAALRQRAEGAITRLWSLYAALEIELRQFKQATKVFESGVGCPVASRAPTVWLQYAEFCIERKKFSNARKVFVRAVNAIADVDHTELWSRFHAFVIQCLDPTMTMEALRAQVVPAVPAPVVPAVQAVPVVPTAPVVPVPVVPAAPVAASPQSTRVVQKANADSSGTSTTIQEPAPVPIVQDSVPAIAEPHSAPASTDLAAATAVVDPALAFVDTKGDADPVAITGVKRKATESPTMSPAKKVALEEEDVKSFLEIPTTLPITPGCPHLLFDQLETQHSIANELLEKLSTVLSDSAVFQGVRDLYENQRNRDRDMLYRWQDLVGMQMKEGSELFARHMDIEKAITDPSKLIELKTQHVEQHREFTNRCRMSQHQFIEISEMDRVSALKAQQISLENMKIPEMTVTTDPGTIDLQRAIVGLILETDKLSRMDKTKKTTPAPARPTGKKPTPAPVAKQPAPRLRADSRDHDAGRPGGRGGRGGGGYSSRGGGSFGRGGGNRRPNSPPRGGRGPPKRHDSYDSRPAPPSRTYDDPPTRQVTYTYQGDSRSRPHGGGPYAGADYGDYQPRDRLHREPERCGPVHSHPGPMQQEYPPRRYADAPTARAGPVSDRRYAPQDAFRGPSPHAGGGRGDPSPFPPAYGRDSHNFHPPAFAGGPPSRYGGEPMGHAPRPQQQQQQQYSAPPPSVSYEYPPPATTVSYAYDTQPPRQAHPQLAPYGHQQPPPHHHLHPQPQRGYGAPAPYQPPPLQHQQPPPQSLHRQPYHSSPPRGGGGGRGGNDRFRRGGGGGGRYGRR